MAFKSFLPSTPTRPTTESRSVPKINELKEVLADSFEFTTILSIGAVLQGFLLLLIPRLWVLLPTIFVILSRAANTFAITKGWIANPYMRGSITQRVTAVLPNKEGEFDQGGHATNETVTIFLLGLRSNHPMGYFAPHMAKINELNQKMSKALDAEAPDNGFLGQTNFTNKAPNGAQDLLLMSYWRTADDVLKFAAGPTHKETWAWWDAHAPELKHIGISHEIFQADRGMYENVYHNFQPTRLGATSFFRQGDKMIGGTVADSWISPLVSASRGKLRSARGRMNITQGDESEKYGYAPEPAEV